MTTAHGYWWHMALLVANAEMEIGLANWPIWDSAHSGMTTYPHHYIAMNDPHWEQPA